MKKYKYIISVGFVLLFFFAIISCAKRDKENMIHGVKAEILFINPELKGFVVKGLEEEGVLGEKCYIGLENDEITFLYCDFETEECQEISYEDFFVGATISMNIDADLVKDSYVVPESVQLITQKEK